MPPLTWVNVPAVADWLTVRVKDCVAFGRTPLLAVIVSGYVPAVPAPAVPLRVAVPLPLLVNVTPLGSVPLRAIVPAVGNPLAVIVNVLATPTVNVAAFALVIAFWIFNFLFISFFTGLQAYQNYYANAYFWFISGVAFAAPSAKRAAGFATQERLASLGSLS